MPEVIPYLEQKQVVQEINLAPCPIKQTRNSDIK